jgi:aerobic-type carbon monoxide dehydrogenase small subunit (CoxS/CutS family)
VHLTVNGRPVSVDPPGSTTLLDLLRDTLALTGTKRACDRGECGACTVHVDGRPVYACLTLAHGCAGQDVRTIEGLGNPDAPHALQEAFAAEDAAQCGFCTPGQLMAAAALLATNADPSDDEVVAAMSGNLCRCGTYPKIVRAVRRAAASMRDTATREAAHG